MMETLKHANERLRKRLIRLAKMLMFANQCAQHDPLTGLPNRSLLLDRMRQAMALANRVDHQLAVLMIDLDGFKLINDTYGHAAGDQVLQSVASRLNGSIRASDTAARLGGDEFVVVLSVISESALLPIVISKIKRSLLRPYLIEGRKLRIAASIGVHLYSGVPETPLDALKAADRAMYLTKVAAKKLAEVPCTMQK